jgi:hypothetical protein
MAIGIEVVPILSEPKVFEKFGKAYPAATPTAIAKNIQSVRNLLREDSLPRWVPVEFDIP